MDELKGQVTISAEAAMKKLVRENVRGHRSNQSITTAEILSFGSDAISGL
jgi:hypothetical protein